MNSLCKKILVIASIISTFNWSANAKEFPAGKVLVQKGEVSILPAHTMESHKLKKGDFVYEDASILTSDKSFIKIKLTNGSFMTIGPKSKAIISLSTKDGASLISLLKGKIRAKVSKKNSKHFFIKTRSASLGVRGTEFQVGFNNDSKRTSLLTYEGEVAIKKVTRQASIPVKSKKIEVKKMEEFLKVEPKLAKVGDFSTVGVKSKEATKPVKINIEQFTRLKLDKTVGAEKLVVKKEIIKELIKENLNEYKKSQVGLKKIDKSKESFKEGGLISTTMGLYIPPVESENKELVQGSILPNGEYIAPKGLKLDAKKGFVAKNEASISIAKKINLQLKKQAVLPKVKEIKKAILPEDKNYKRYFD